MPSLTKRVNVKIRLPIYNINPPLLSDAKDIIMTTGNILKCLEKRAIVDEVLPDGSTVRLNRHNYYTDNGGGLYAKKPYTDPLAPKNTTLTVNNSTDLSSAAVIPQPEPGDDGSEDIPVEDEIATTIEGPATIAEGEIPLTEVAPVAEEITATVAEEAPVEIAPAPKKTTRKKKKEE